MSQITTPEQLLAEYAPTPQNRAAVAVIDRRIEALREQMESCDAAEITRHQGAVQALRSLRRLADGLPE